MSSILDRMAEALEAASEYAPADAEREALLAEYRAHRWFVTQAGREPETQGDESA